MNSSAVYEVQSLVARAATSTNSATRPPIYKVVGLCLAIAAGLFIGTSFVLKKIGLLRANEKYNEEAGEGYGYLKNAYWWAGMSLMIVGEICNFVAYAFVDAILVTPLGALSVVVTTILSAIFLKERLSFVGKIGCFNCIVGSIVIVLNAPTQSAVADIQQMKGFVLSPGFLSYAGVVVVASAFIALWAGPRYGKKSMLVYLSVCSLIGGLSVVATQGLGSAIVAQAAGKPQFNQWFLYLLLVFVITTLVTEIIYLNKALNLFNAALVTPTYYVFFTSATIVTSAVLFRGFKGTPISITTVIMGFLQICTGVVLLQLSKSAKDVPDAAVFKGDLDQVREVAEQEQPETEPKADAIRGAAGIIRRLSTVRRNMEQREFQRLRTEKSQDLEPLRENEIVEWDGLRRRKTIIGGGPPSPIHRRQTVHPPLGMSYFPDDDNTTNNDEGSQPNNHSGVFDAIRDRASVLLHIPGHRNSNRHAHDDSIDPVAMTPIDVRPNKIDYPDMPYGGVDGEDDTREHVLGMPAGLRKSSRETKPMFSPRSKPLPAQPEPSPVPGSARRQFSFTNFIHRGARTPLHDEYEDMLPPNRTALASRGSSYSHEQKKAMKNATEEERLGLVKGDSNRALLESSPERIPQYSHSKSPSLSSVDDAPEPIRARALSDSDDDDGWQMTHRSDAAPTTTTTTISTAATTRIERTPSYSHTNHPSVSTRSGSRKRPPPPLSYLQDRPSLPMPDLGPPTLSPPYQRTVERKPVPGQLLGQSSAYLPRPTYDRGVEPESVRPAVDLSGHSRTLSMSHVPSPGASRSLMEDHDQKEVVGGDDDDSDDDDNHNADYSYDFRARNRSFSEAQAGSSEVTNLRGRDPELVQQQRFREKSQKEREKRRQRLSIGVGGATLPRAD